MQKRWRFVCALDLFGQKLATRGDRDDFVLHFGAGHAVHDRLDELLASRFEKRQLSLGGRLLGAARHPQPVHLPRELKAEFSEQVLAEEIVLRRPKYPRFYLISPDREAIGARPLFAGTEAHQAVG